MYYRSRRGAFEKRHFRRIADHIRAQATVGDRTLMAPKVLATLCHFFKGDNPNFNSTRFYDYIHGLCGPHGGRIRRKKTPSKYTETC